MRTEDVVLEAVINWFRLEGCYVEDLKIAEGSSVSLRMENGKLNLRDLAAEITFELERNSK